MPIDGLEAPGAILRVPGPWAEADQTHEGAARRAEWARAQLAARCTRNRAPQAPQAPEPSTLSEVGVSHVAGARLGRSPVAWRHVVHVRLSVELDHSARLRKGRMEAS